MKNFTVILCCILFSSMAFSQDLTINVEVCESASEVRMTGPWWSWAVDGGPLASKNTNGTWTITMPDMTNDKVMEYLFVVDGVQENLIQVMADGGSCAPVTDYSSYANRKWDGATDSLTIDATYGKCTACDNDCDGIDCDASTGVTEANFSELSIFPNPTTDYLVVSNATSFDRLRIVNLFGSVVLNQITLGNLTRLDLSDFSPGIYFVRVFSNNQEAIKKISVK